MEYVGGLLPLLIIGGIIAAIVSAVRKRGRDRDPDAPGTSSRQVFFYLFSFTALMVSAAGGSVLVDYIVDSLRGNDLVTPSQNQLALGLALTIVGTPAWALTWRQLLKAAETSSYERSSDVRGLYVYVIELVSISFVAAGLVSLLTVIFGGSSFSGTDIAWPLIWGLMWGYHWRLESRLTADERAATPFRSIYVYILSMASLILLLVGVGMVMSRLIDRAYADLFLDRSFISINLWSDTIKTGLALGLVGAAGWWFHWFRTAGERPGILLRQLYIYIFGVLFGFVTVIVTSSIGMALVLQWILGAPRIEPLDEHFRVFVGLIPSLLAGVMLWTYHAAVMRREAEGAAKDSAIRIYNHIMAWLSLATLSSGFIFLVALFISASSRGACDYVGDNGWQGQLSVVLTLLIVGGSIWGYYWSRIQRTARDNPADLETTSRKLHIYSVFGISALAALGTLSATLYLFLDAILDSSLTTDTLRSAQWPIAVLVTSGVVSGYYLLVIREDRRVLALREPTDEQRKEQVKKRVTLLTHESSGAIAGEIEQRLGYSVNLWLQPDGDDASPEQTAQPTTEAIDEAIAAINAAATDSVLVLVEGATLQVRPFRRS